MDQLKLPTDNLYKFVALSGVAIFLLAAWLAIYPFGAALEFAREAEVNMSDLVSDVMEAEKQGLDTISENQNELLTEYFRNETRAESIVAMQEGLMTTYALLAGIGVLIALFGFTLWYNKTQKYADQILRLQAESLMDGSNKLENATPQSS